MVEGHSVRSVIVVETLQCDFDVVLLGIRIDDRVETFSKDFGDIPRTRADVMCESRRAIVYIVVVPDDIVEVAALEVGPIALIVVPVEVGTCIQNSFELSIF